MPRNWEEYYSDPANLNFAPEPLLIQAAEWLPPGRALDLACGAGRNALYLASLGWDVTAVDSSPAAIRALLEHAAPRRIEAAVQDIETGSFSIEPGRYNLICDFFYLHRDLFPAIREGVAPGGTFVAAIHLVGTDPGAPPRNPAYLLRPGELQAEFDGWKVLFYSEATEPEHSRPTARIVARRA